MGWDVGTANNGQEAIDFILKTTFAQQDSLIKLDLCLMDCEMPVMNGLTAARTIRELEAKGTFSYHVSIIAVTANARDEQRKSVCAAYCFIGY